MLRSIGRIVWVVIAFGLAVVAGIGLLGLVGLERFTATLEGQAPADGELGQWIDLVNLALGFGEWAAALSVAPALLVVVIGELGRIRSLVYWVAAGGAAAVAAPVLNGLVAATPELALPGTSMLQILATAGFGAGVVYWALAGRLS